MAIFNSTILEGASGSVGNITLCKYKKKNVVKGKIVFKTKKKSEAQHIQQLRFKTLTQLAYTFCRAAIEGFPGDSWAQARRAFIKHNQKAVKVNDTTFETIVSLEEIVCSAGKLTPPNIQAHLQEDERTIHTKWFRQPLSPIAKDEDNLYMILLDTRKKDTVVYLLGKRGEPGEKELSLPEDFTPANLLVYTFARSVLQTNTSDTTFINLELAKSTRTNVP